MLRDTGGSVTHERGRFELLGCTRCSKHDGVAERVCGLVRHQGPSVTGALGAPWGCRGLISCIFPQRVRLGTLDVGTWTWREVGARHPGVTQTWLRMDAELISPRSSGPFHPLHVWRFYPHVPEKK
eukprot:4779606-Prymnesium_polylepis.2